MPVSQRTTRSKETDTVTEGATQGAKLSLAQAKRLMKCYMYPVGVGHKKQKQEKQTSPRQTAAKGRKKPQPGLTQATVDSLAEVKAEQSDVKLVDPNTGEEVQAKNQSVAQPAEQAVSKPKSKKGTKIVDPNSGKEVDAAAEQFNKPATTQQTGTSSAAKKDEKSAPAEAAEPESASEKEQFVKINRAPVLTLWVAVVAERQGFSKEAGMTFGKAISGMLAQSKGRAIGVMNKRDDTVAAKEEKEDEEHKQGIAKHDVFGMSIKAKDVGDDGDVRAVDTNSQVISDRSVDGYLKRAFKDQLEVARDALSKLATSYKPEEIGHHCYHLYEQFRPSVASGRQGWGQAGHLDLNQLRDMTDNHSL